MEEVRSCKITIPKHRVCAKKSHLLAKPYRHKSEVFTRNPGGETLQKYYLPGGKPLGIDKLKNDQLLLPYRLFAKKQDNERHKTKLAIKVNDKYKIGSADLCKRLQIEYPPPDVWAITDVDEKFFTYVNGRILPYSIPVFKSLRPMLDAVLRIRQEVSYRKDNILNIETKMKRELNTCKSSLQVCIDEAKYFDSFISEDYLKSMGFLDKWDDLRTELDLKVVELHNLACDKFAIMSRLIGLDSQYSVQQKYGRFLYYLSPPTWRLNNRDFARSIEIETKGFDLGHSSDEDPFVVIFEKLQKESTTKRVLPALYFTHPEDLMQLFEGIQRQQLHHLTHINSRAPYTNSLKEGLKLLKNNIKQDSHNLVNAIKSFQTALVSYDARSEFLKEKFHKIVNGQFYESVGAPDVLKLVLHLEFCYEKVIGEKPMNLGMVTVAKALEKCYLDYSSSLEAFTSNKISLAVTHYFESEKEKLRKAKLAARELRQFTRLEKELRRSCLPSILEPANPLKLVKRRVSCKLKKQKKSEVVAVTCHRTSLTEAELDYLALFTDWTEKDDPAQLSSIPCKCISGE